MSWRRGCASDHRSIPGRAPLPELGHRSGWSGPSYLSWRGPTRRPRNGRDSPRARPETLPHPKRPRSEHQLVPYAVQIAPSAPGELVSGGVELVEVAEGGLAQPHAPSGFTTGRRLDRGGNRAAHLVVA